MKNHVTGPEDKRLKKLSEKAFCDVLKRLHEEWAGLCEDFSDREDGEFTVTYYAKSVGCSYATANRKLIVMQQKGVVTRREGKNGNGQPVKYYRLLK